MTERNFTQVIGGSGFIGSRLCTRFSSCGHPFQIIDKVCSADYPNSTVVADVRDITSLRDAIAPGSVLVNLAAEHRDDVKPVSAYFDVNVKGAENICTVATEKGIRTIVFTSSVAVYGFAEIGTGEQGKISPFNEYGRTKALAEEIFKKWQAEQPRDRTLVVVRPTVVFGERNRGNVYNLLRQIASRRFVMIGSGSNRKSVAYVENVAAFLQDRLTSDPGVHIYNYVDKPDFTMSALVRTVMSALGRSEATALRIPYHLGLLVGKAFDGVAALTGKRFPISSIRVKKFCSNSVYSSAVPSTGFVPPVSLENAIEHTVRYEFIEKTVPASLFYTE
jgi:GlcNAc-P-P-Und epimerase